MKKHSQFRGIIQTLVSGLEGALVSIGKLARTVAVTGDFKVGHLGHGWSSFARNFFFRRRIFFSVFFFVRNQNSELFLTHATNKKLSKVNF